MTPNAHHQDQARTGTDALEHQGQGRCTDPDGWSTTTSTRRPGSWREELAESIKTLASAAVYATLIVTFIGQMARVEGTSMLPTLADQDRLVVNKLTYRFHDPQRGDVVMLYYPEDPDTSFVKRIIGEPGDEIRIVDGRVFVNDVALLDDFVAAEFRSHDDFGPSLVPRGYYFVMGDHRNNCLVTPTG